MGKTCQICGNNSGIYPLCKTHLEMKSKGLVIKNEETGLWKLKEDKIKNDDIENSNCIICNNETNNNNLFCRQCYKEIKYIKENFNHNKNSRQITNQYYEIYSSSLNTDNKETLNDNFLYLYALAEENNHINENSTLLNKVKKDIFNLIENFNSKEIKNKTSNNINDEDFRSKWPREHQCDDGHYVRSLSEMIIDNWLYNNGYVHAYEKSVYMETNPDAVVLSDFYLPKLNVYIEFWGIEEDEKYLKRKNEKIQLYDNNNYQRIDLTEKDIKRLNDIMPKILGQYKK